MKISKYSALIGLFAIGTLGSCKDFQEINNDQNAVSEKDVKIEFLLNKSIYEAQMGPHIAERMFILYWDRVARYERAGGLAIMTPDDGYSTDYWNDYGMQWAKNVNLAVTIGESRLEAGTTRKQDVYNTIQMARIWRAYVFSEIADNFGSIPRSDAFKITAPNFDKLEDIYTFILSELKDAASKIDMDLPKVPNIDKYDQIFQGDLTKWVNYANSMRMRFAMRLINVKPDVARAEFEDAASKPNILTLADMAAVQEGGGWDATTGVMTRSWNWQQVSMTMNNLCFGLGGINVSNMTNIKGLSVSGLDAATINMYAKDPTQYLGLYVPNYKSLRTNVDNAGYLFDAIPAVSDPRLFKNYSLPGYNDGVVSKFAGAPADAAETETDNTKIAVYGMIVKGKDIDSKIKLRTAYTWTSIGYGSWAEKSALLAGVILNKNMPCKSAKWCDNKQKRVFFGPWETYFLLAEASHYGWNTGTTVKDAYENGIKASFEYQEVSTLANDYIASESYNMVGTSVAIGHTAEAAAKQMSRVVLSENLVADGAKVEKLKENPDVTNVTYNYPQGFYSTNNDILTKIITQKYIAQCPWLPNEAWSDYRRLGLPFMENPYNESELVNMPWYQGEAYKVADLRNIAGRLAYPQSLVINNKKGYLQGVADLGGPDKASTPLWWAKKQ